MILSFPLKYDIFANWYIIELEYILSSPSNFFELMSTLKNLINLCVTMIQSISRGFSIDLRTYLETIVTWRQWVVNVSWLFGIDVHIEEFDKALCDYEELNYEESRRIGIILKVLKWFFWFRVYQFNLLWHQYLFSFSLGNLGEITPPYNS